MMRYETCLYFMARHSCSSLERELQNRGCSSAKEVLPVDRINVGALGVFFAGILLALEAPMVGIVKFDYKSFDSLAIFLNSDQHSSAAICQSIQSVHIVDKHHLSSDLQLEHS